MKPFQTLRGWCVCIGLVLLLLACLPAANAQVRMRSNLYIVDANGTTLMDGNMTNYNSAYSNDVDGYDIWKMSNFGENFGILRSTANLVIERRNIIQNTDTTYFRMWNLQPRNYRLQVIAENLHSFNLIAFVRDRYLNQDVPVDLNDSTNLDFTINSQPGSYAQNRFLLIYINASMSSTLPVSFTSVQANRKNNDVQVSWTVSNEVSLQQYELEHSIDGLTYEEIYRAAPKHGAGGMAYNHIHQQAHIGQNYYRVKALSIGGKVQYSAIARVGPEAGTPAFSVYPNPVVDKKLQLQMNVANAGSYTFSISSSNGSRQILEKQNLGSGVLNRTISLPGNLIPGIYQLQIITPDNNILLKTISVL